VGLSRARRNGASCRTKSSRAPDQLRKLALHFGDESVVQRKRYRAANSKAAIDETPAKRNAADGSSDEGERDDASTRDQTECDDPFIADRNRGRVR
jgi:hypothetical protein